ncbi:LPS-assembly protein LptD [Sphingoaurantiacus capsulatus]|uniref:LPS-assembly protein LptD n=1 Tax=Sphingoaurantiacus capsulatus TaxID=1771310 RepID=A0ABV7XF54_9SPHN
MRLRPSLLLLGAALCGLTAPTYAQEAPPPDATEARDPAEATATPDQLYGGPPVPEVVDPTAEVDADQVIDFAADTLSYDEGADIVTASGNVILVRGGYRLRAQTVEYNRRSGVVEARGNVIVIDPGGNQAFGDRVELTESLRDGAIENILLVLQDGGRLAARSGKRVDGRSELDRAIYSPCDIDDSEGCPKKPVWQIKAVKIIHDPARERMTYRHAYFELFGIPVLYLPSLSHPVGGSGSAGGLLVPDIRLDRSLGLELKVPYYLSLAKNRDLTITPYLYTDANPMLGAEYRHLFGGGPARVGGLITKATRETTAGNDKNDVRGYFFANGRLQHSTAWRSTLGVRLTTDDTFLRRYDISRDDTLRNFYTLERFGGTSYLSIEGWAFQGLRADDRAGQQPIALPLVDFQWRPELDALGGRLEVRANTLAITRTDGQDTQRALAQVRWDAATYTPMGQRVTATAMFRADAYHTNDTDLSPFPIYSGKDGWSGRAIPVAALDAEWPFAGPAFGGMQTLTPRVQLVGSGKGDNSDIPNEDARAVDLDDLNLFSLNRFNGFDRWGGGARVTYGARWTLDRPNWRVELEGGQSYRFDKDSDLFPVGTGLSGNFSDFVGRSTLKIGSFVDVTHRFRVDKNGLEVRRNEIDATIGSRRTYATIGYVRLNRDIQLEDLQDREEARVGGRVAFARYWSLFGSAIVDLTGRGEDPLNLSDGYEPIRHRVGIAYEDECFELGVTWRRDYTQDRDFRAGNTFLIRLSLKNLGR